MKEKVNPAVAVGLIVALIALAAGAIYWKVSGAPTDDGSKPPPIPADAAERLKTITGNMSGRPGGGGMTAPPSGGKSGMAAMPGGGMTAPPSGGGGGMTAPPGGGQ